MTSDGAPPAPWSGSGRPPPYQVSALIEGQLRALVLDTPFPCAGARSALRNHGYVFGVYADMRERQSLRQMAADLGDFVRTRHELGDFYTFIASFIEPATVPDEKSWDALVWDLLQRLHDVDTEEWDDRWSTDPADADFALSFGGCGLLVVCLYPGASRFARRFAWPTIIFNPPEQDRANFPDDESFLRFQNRIRARDARLQGTMNPSLPPTLDDPQAPGFSGAPVGDDWRCPLVVRPPAGQRPRREDRSSGPKPASGDIDQE